MGLAAKIQASPAKVKCEYAHRVISCIFLRAHYLLLYFLSSIFSTNTYIHTLAFSYWTQVCCSLVVHFQFLEMRLDTCQRLWGVILCFPLEQENEVVSAHTHTVKLGTGRKQDVGFAAKKVAGYPHLWCKLYFEALLQIQYYSKEVRES